MAGQKVVQIYYTAPPSRITRYKKMLAGFGKVGVPARGEAVASINFELASLGHWDPRTSTHVLDGGVYTLMVCEHALVPSAQCLTHQITV